MHRSRGYHANKISESEAILGFDRHVVFVSRLSFLSQKDAE